MKAKNVTREQLDAALSAVNQAQGYSLRWNRSPEPHGLFWHFTLRSERSKLHGAAVSGSGRNTCAASWEAHGNFFNEVFALAPEAEIRTARATYTKGVPWHDYNVGSLARPMYASQNAFAG